ncbi:hypothetical protein TWF281_004787 [Arthrobotrys megalospora]
MKLRLKNMKNKILQSYYKADSGSRYSVLGEDKLLNKAKMSQESSIPRYGNLTATQKALGINEILEHILLFVNPINPDPGATETQYCDVSDGFWDLMYTCRQVNKHWRVMINSSYILQKRMWLSKYYKVQKNGDPILKLDPSDEKVIDPKDFVKSLKSEEARPKVTLCYPLFSWLVRYIRDLRRAEKQRLEEEGRDPNKDFYEVDFTKVKEQFLQIQFPNVFFTEPPISEARIHFETNHPLQWDSSMYGSKIFPDGDKETNPNLSLTAVRCGYHRTATVGYPNGLLISNPAGITVSDIIFAFDEYIKVSADPERSWNKGKPHPWQLEMFSIGTVTMCPEDDKSGIIGFCELFAEIDMDIFDGDGDYFTIFNKDGVRSSEKSMR